MTESKSPVDDLFGDEDLPLGPTQPVAASPEKKPTRLVPFGIAILFIAGFWYLSSQQNQQFYLVVEDNMVHVERGYFFPAGSGDWAPSRAYEPFRLPETMEIASADSLSAKELDTTLLHVYMRIAKGQLKDLKNGDPDLAEDMIWRAQKLRSTSVADDRRTWTLLGDVAFRRGLTEVRSIQARFDEALEHFNMASIRGGDAYQNARTWVEAISRLRSEFRKLALESGLDPDLILPTSKKEGEPPPTTTPAPKPLVKEPDQTAKPPMAGTRSPETAPKEQ